MKVPGIKVITENRKAWHDYFVDETYEAGIALVGTEVKSVRAGAVNLKDSYCSFEKGEIFVNGMHISPYKEGNMFNHEPLREKKLLMHKKEINKLFGLASQKGFSVIPLKLYFSNGKVKLAIGLCRGKKLYDKREADAKKMAQREMERSYKATNN